MKKLLLTGAMLASACSGKGEIIPTPSPEPQTPTTADPNYQALPAAPPTTTTAPTPEPAPSTTVPAPILCPQLAHPDHHSPCPPPTTRYLREEAVIESSTEWAIPTYIVMCESGGRWDAYNASGASGPYQLMPLHFGGELAMYQSREAQHAKAAELWNGGRGKSHWSACL